jgi:endonuclease YncB( thermonuclease family)
MHRVTIVIVGLMIAITASAKLIARETCLVHYVIDGDSFECKIGGQVQRVRLLGIDTLEVKHGRKGSDECHGPQAETAMKRLILNKVVSLRSESDATSGTRFARYVFVQQGGKWIDAGRELLALGHAVQFTRVLENPLAKAYNNVSFAARKRGKNIWDTNFCGKGPRAQLTVSIRYAQRGRNLNNEYVTIKNKGKNAVRLHGWHIRPMLHVNKYRFPKGTVLQGGKSIRVRTGKGRNNETDLYWRNPNQIFPNPNKKTGYAPAVYLIDPKGNFRAWKVYNP